MGAVVSRVLEGARCPVITASNRDVVRSVAPLPARRSDRNASRSIRGVLAATDLSDVSSAGLTFARWLGEALHCPVHVLHVVESPWTRSPAYASPPPETIETLRRTAARTLTDCDRREGLVQASSSCGRPLVRIGDPATEIVRCAEDLGDDLIVVGTHGRSARGRRMLGSVARDVLARATCPILTISPLSARRIRQRTEAVAERPPETTTVATTRRLALTAGAA
jgi:nucleotide-binding universal stress UspA family protein